MSNKCPMCGGAEDEHTEVLRALRPFYEAHEHALALQAAQPGGEADMLLQGNRYLTQCITAAADLYRKLKTR